MLVHLYGCYDSPHGQSSRTHDYAVAFADMGLEVVFCTSTYNHLDGQIDNAKISKEQGCDLPYKVRLFRGIVYRGNGIWRLAHMVSHTIQLLLYGLYVKKPDIIIATSVPQSVGLAALIVSKIKRIPMVYEVRDVWPHELIALGAVKPRSLTSKIMTWSQNYLYKNSNLIITALPGVIEQVKTICLSQTVIYIPNGIYCGFEHDEYSSAVDLTNSKEIIDKEKKEKVVKIMYAGSFSLAQDIKTLILACKKLDLAEIQYACEIVGDGPLYKEFVSYADELQVNGINFVGRLSKLDLKKALTTADILVSCHSNNELFKYGINSNKLYDYLWSGKPVVFAANVTEDPISVSGAGFKVDAEDSDGLSTALGRLINMSESKRLGLGRSGQEYIKRNHDIKKLAQKYRLALIDLTQAQH